jgi:t-SNARE complex subunit (syntaxin)
LPAALKFKGVALNEIQQEKKQLDKQLEKEIEILTQKFEKLSEPLLQRSADIIDGSCLPTRENLKTLAEFCND